MSKKKSWLCLIKRFFFSEPHHHRQQKRSQRRRIWLFGRLKRTKGLLPPSLSPSPSLTPPPPAPPPLLLPVQMTKLEPEKKQSKWETDAVSVDHRHEKDVESLAATKIQTAYRGYLARKALRALKGLVRLQAIIRGRAVRRQAMTTLKCLQAIVNIQSQVCSKRGQMALAEHTDLQVQGLHDGDEFKTEISKHRRLDSGLLPKENEVDIILKNKEAMLRRQRNKANSNNHRISADSEEAKVEGCQRNWLEQYVSDQVLSNKEHKTVLKHLKLKNTECLNSLSLHRRSFHTHRKHSSSENASQSPGWPTATPAYMAATESARAVDNPAYMAATESARAKARSTSNPRPRPILMDCAYSDGDSPYKDKLIISPMSTTRSEMTSCGFSRVSNKSSCSNSQLKCPTLKGLPSAVRSKRDAKKDVSLDSENLVVIS